MTVSEISSAQNKQLVNEFYTAFAAKDHATMRSIYAEQATFSDPVFTLQGQKNIGDMWQMLCTRGKDMVLEYDVLEVTDTACTVQWRASYTFSQTGRKVHNIIKATLTIEDGRIVKHDDDFNFKSWAKQALGLPGALLGGTKFLQTKVSAKANEGLGDFQKRL